MQVFVFNKKGDQAAKLDVPAHVYLKSEKEFIDEALIRTELDGIAIKVDWEKRELRMIRHAQ